MLRRTPEILFILGIKRLGEKMNFAKQIATLFLAAVAFFSISCSDKSSDDNPIIPIDTTEESSSSSSVILSETEKVSSSSSSSVILSEVEGSRTVSPLTSSSERSGGDPGAHLS